MHPGVVDSNFVAHADEVMRGHMQKQGGKPPEHPAQTLVFLATSPEAGRDGGRYFHDCKEVARFPRRATTKQRDACGERAKGCWQS
jgi:hypothetical protein